MMNSGQKAPACEPTSQCLLPWGGEGLRLTLEVLVCLYELDHE